MNSIASAQQQGYIAVCSADALVANSGIGLLVNGQQLAVFYLPTTEQQVYAIGNWDPIGRANVLSRGMVGDIGGRLVVASPLYKQHFDLHSGECLEQAEQQVPVYAVKLVDQQLLVKI